MTVTPRFDLETRCGSCKAYRYNDSNEEGTWHGDVWSCSTCSGGTLIERTEKLLKFHDDGILVHKEEYAKLLREWAHLG